MQQFTLAQKWVHKRKTYMRSIARLLFVVRNPTECGMFVALQRLTPPLINGVSTAVGFVEIVGTISTVCVAHRTHFSWLTQLLKRHRGDAHRKQSEKTAFVFAISNRDENCCYRFLQNAEKRQFRAIFVLVQSGKCSFRYYVRFAHYESHFHGVQGCSLPCNDLHHCFRRLTAKNIDNQSQVHQNELGCPPNVNKAA